MALGGAGGNDGAPIEEGGGGRGDDEDDVMDPDGEAGPQIRLAPSIVGEAIEGAALTASFGEYSDGAALEGVWQRCADGTCRDAADAEDGADYTLGTADVGHRMRLKVTATDADSTNITTTAKGRIDGVVTKVTNESGVNMVWIGETKVPLDSVIGVTNPTTTTT
jgi:hypothetical protein